MKQKRLSFRPPRLCGWLFRILFPDNGGLSTYGDLSEVYFRLVQEKGRLLANLWFRGQLVKAVPPLIKNLLYWSFIMIGSYLKVALRYSKRQKIYSFINTAGLAAGMACSLLIMLWIQDEISFDNFHEHKNQIRRVICIGENAFFGSPAPLGPAMIEEIAEVEDAVRIVESPRFVLKYRENAFYEENGIVADPSLFEIFTFPFILGDPGTAFSGPMDIVLTESTARKYFGEEDPINKTLRIEGRSDLTVKGVIKDIPENSHFRFDFVLPYRFAGVYRFCGLKWGDFNFRTYIKTNPDVDPEVLAAKINALAEKHGCPQVVDLQLVFGTQPLEKIYLNPVGNYDIPLGNKKFIYLFSAIAFFILFIACVNFINLSTARSEKRAREIGMRKVLGAHRGQVIRQHLVESQIMVFVSLFLGILLVFLLLPLFNQLTGKHLVLDLKDIELMAALFIGSGVVGLLAGFYPALYLSAISPALMMKGTSPFLQLLRNRQAAVSTRGNLRKVLVVLQFSISIILIVSTLTVSAQLNFMRNKSWTIKNDLIIHIPVKENIGPKYDLVKSELLNHPDISFVAVKDCLPTTLRNNTMGIGWDGKTPDQNGIHMETTRIGFDYFKTMKMEITAGRDFSKEFQGDLGSAFILNEEAVRQMGISDPVGKKFRLYGTMGSIVGIVRDTHFHNLRTTLRPQVYYLFENLAGQGFGGSVLIRIKGPFQGDSRSRLDRVLAHVEKIWGEVNSFAPFEYHFLDETIDAQYRNEQRLGKLFGYFASLAILISCLGLFGLAAFTSEQRTKEIGIRKTLGASSRNIILMLSRDFSKWVLMANLIAVPVAWYAMHQWLRSFAYRTSVPVWIFFAAGLMALVIAWITVSFQTFRTARTDPIKALRYE